MSLNYSEVEEIAIDKTPLRQAAHQGEASTEARDLLLHIEEAAAGEDRSTLSRLVENVNWRSRHPDDLIRVIQACIFVDMVLLARELAGEGRRLFPNDKRMAQWASVLAPPKIIGTRPASGNAIGLEASHQWFQNNSFKYKGQWIAVRNGELLGVAPTLKELYNQIGQDKKAPDTIVVKALS
ncbi:MAG: DUF5678 domain-containing protein [bacterium]